MPGKYTTAVDIPLLQCIMHSSPVSESKLCKLKNRHCYLELAGRAVGRRGSLFNLDKSYSVDIAELGIGYSIYTQVPGSMIAFNMTSWIEFSFTNRTDGIL